MINCKQLYKHYNSMYLQLIYLQNCLYIKNTVFVVKKVCIHFIKVKQMIFIQFSIMNFMVYKLLQFYNPRIGLIYFSISVDLAIDVLLSYSYQWWPQFVQRLGARIILVPSHNLYPASTFETCQAITNISHIISDYLQNQMGKRSKS